MTDIARKEPSNAKKSLQTRETPSQQSSGFRWSVLLIEIPGCNFCKLDFSYECF
jgi:hypothetical protein